PVITVASALGSLEIIALGSQDPAEPRTCPHDIDDNCRQFGAGRIRYRFLLEADARARGRCHYPRACTGRAVDHVHRSDFALGLYESAPVLGHFFCEIMGYLGLRCDWITEIVPAACSQCSFGDHLVALHK